MREWLLVSAKDYDVNAYGMSLASEAMAMVDELFPSLERSLARLLGW
jgi:hypothetical protein